MGSEITWVPYFPTGLYRDGSWWMVCINGQSCGPAALWLVVLAAAALAAGVAVRGATLQIVRNWKARRR